MHRFNNHGIHGLLNRPRKGRPTTLSLDKLKAFRDYLLQITSDGDACAALRGEDIRRLLKERFGADYSDSGTYVLLQRLGLSDLLFRQPEKDCT